MAKNIVLICGGYHPNFSATGNCVRQIANCFVIRGMNVYLLSISPDANESTEDFEGQKIYRVVSKRSKAFADIRSNKMGRLKVVAVKSYWAVRKLLAKSGMDEGLVKAYVNKLEEISDIKIDAVLPCIMPAESFKAGYIFCKKHGIPLFPILYDRYSDNRDYFRYTWAHKLKRKSAEKLEKDVFDYSKMVYYIDNWAGYFAANRRDNAMRVEHPLVVKRADIPAKPLDGATEITAVYQGEINHQMRPPQAMLTAFETIAKNDPSVSLHVFASGNGVEDVKSAAARNPESIKFYGKVSKELAEQYYSAADFTVILANKDKEIVSSKIFESVASGYPVIYFYFSEDETSYKLLQKYPLVLCVRQDKVAEECDRIREWMYENKGRRVDFELVRKAYDDATPDMVVDTSLGILEGVKTGNG